VGKGVAVTARFAGSFAAGAWLGAVLPTGMLMTKSVWLQPVESRINVITVIKSLPGKDFILDIKVMQTCNGWIELTGRIITPPAAFSNHRAHTRWL